MKGVGYNVTHFSEFRFFQNVNKWFGAGVLGGQYQLKKYI